MCVYHWYLYWHGELQGSSTWGAASYAVSVSDEQTPELMQNYGWEFKCKEKLRKKKSKSKVMVTKATMILPCLYSSSAVCFSVPLSSDVLIYTCSVAELLWEPKLWGIFDADPLQSTREDRGLCFCFSIHFSFGYDPKIGVSKDK